MDESRADRILRDWDSLASAAPPPLMRVRRSTPVRRSSGRSAASAVAVTALAMLAILGWWLSRPNESVGPTVSAALSPGPTVSHDRSASPAVMVDCGPFDKVECAAIAAVTAHAQPPGTLRSIVLDRYIPACIRAGMCGHPHGGYPWDVTVIGTDLTGSIIGWACSYVALAATCEEGQEEVIGALATLAFRLTGVDQEDILLRDKSGGVVGFTAADGVDRPITAGTWDLLTRGTPCVGCDRAIPPFQGSPPPEWCSARIEATPGARIDVDVVISPGTPCKIHATSSESPQ